MKKTPKGNHMPTETLGAINSVLAAGIHAGVPMMKYVNDPCPEPSLSKGVIDDLIHRSPLHAYGDHPKLGGKSDTGSKRADLGSAAHAMLLGGSELITYCDATYASGKRKGEIATDWTARDAQEFQKVARAMGKIPMLAHEAGALETMVSIARPLLEGFGAGDVEQTMIWQDGETWGRARPDWIAEDRKIIIDYKTANNADPAVWIHRVLLHSDYDLQAAWYLRGLGILEGKAERDFLFLVQEIEPPYACSVVGVGPEMLELAQRKVEAGLRLWRDCLSKETWPGYDTKTHWAELPQYIVWDWENRAVSYGAENRGES